MYRCKHFILQELVGPEIFQARGERAWELLQPAILITLDRVHDLFGAVTVNNWHAGGDFKESGLRNFNTLTGALYSMHKYGGAMDMKFRTVTPEEVSKYLLEHRTDFPELTCLENAEITKTWLHADCRNHSKSWIVVVNP